MNYYIKLEHKGSVAYLSVNGRNSWKTFRIAKKHAKEAMDQRIYTRVSVENEFGDCISWRERY